jgi:hypothetical protein
MKKVIVIPLAALGMLLAGLGFVAASQGSDPEPSCNAPIISPYGPFERAWGEDGEPVPCDTIPNVAP